MGQKFIGNSLSISVKISRYEFTGVRCGASQSTSHLCRVVLDAMPVSYNNLQKYGPPSDPTVTVPLPWSLVKSDSRKACESSNDIF